MKIAFILPAFYPYNKGTPAGILEKCRTLKKFGHKVIVVCYHRFEKRNPYAKVYRIPKNPFYKKGSGPAFSRILLDFFLFLQSVRIVKKEKPNIIHAVGQEGALIALFLKKIFKIPFIFDIASTLRDELIESGFSNSKSFITKIGSYLDKKLPQKADFNITVSQKVFERLKKEGLEKIKLIPDTIDLNFFKPAAFKKPADRIFIGYQGSLSNIQNVNLILKISKEIIQKNSQIFFKIGSSEDLKKLSQKIKKENLFKKIVLEKIDFPKTPFFINSCDIMVIPRKLFFGTPLKLLNFLACGKPVIAFKDVVENLTKEDIVVKVKNETDFQKAILKLASDESLRKIYAKKARNFALKKFNRQRQYQKLISVYKKVLSL